MGPCRCVFIAIILPFVSLLYRCQISTRIKERGDFKAVSHNAAVGAPLVGHSRHSASSHRHRHRRTATLASGNRNGIDGDRPRTRRPPVDDETLDAEDGLGIRTASPMLSSTSERLDDGSVQQDNIFTLRQRTWMAPATSLSLPSPAPTTSLPLPSAAPALVDKTPAIITYQPGNFSLKQRSDDGLVILSNGLSARRIAKSGDYITFDDGSLSTERFHLLPDAAGIFDMPDTSRYYLYVSNAEVDSSGDSYFDGGVGAITIDSVSGSITNYTRLLNETRRNCGGGKTPWNSWISCEEFDNGRVHQVDPYNEIAPARTELGDLGWYESFAYDTTISPPTFYVTRDRIDGVLTRFTPNDVGTQCFQATTDSDRWCTLNHGTLDYLELRPSDENESQGTFQWTTNMTAAEESAKLYFPFAEGIDSVDGTIYFVSKRLKRLVVLHLHNNTFMWDSTQHGVFEHQPDQVARLVDQDGNDENSGILYLTEDGGKGDPGVHGRSKSGEYFTILYGNMSIDKEETSGLSISPDGMHLYVAFQKSGLLYAVSRTDGRPFGGATLDIKYHAE
jgi:hypothetical protein